MTAPTKGGVMSQIRIKPTAAISVIEGGYMARTMGKGYLSSAPVSAWTQFFHKPYADDWKEARGRALARCRRDGVSQDSIIVTATKS